MPAVPITTRRAAWLSLVWLAAGLAVGLVLLGSLGTERAVNYWSVYVLERSLSLDNVFVFLLILDYFLIPRDYRRARRALGDRVRPRAAGTDDRRRRSAARDLLRRDIPARRRAAPPRSSHAAQPRRAD